DHRAGRAGPGRQLVPRRHRADLADRRHRVPARNTYPLTIRSFALRTVARAAVLCGAVLTATAIGVLPASAHVTVPSADAAPGGYAELTFRVPTERNDASTTKLQVNFPADAPLASVSVKPHPGWSFQVTNKKLTKPLTTDDGSVDTVVSAITWTAK